MDLQALTVGAALLTMHRWLAQLRESLLLADAALLGGPTDCAQVWEQRGARGIPFTGFFIGSPISCRSSQSSGSRVWAL